MKTSKTSPKTPQQFNPNRSLTLKSRRLTVATVLCALALSSGGLRAATNVLVNPGFETGDFTGWSVYGAHAVESTNNTYYNGGNPGGSNVLTHAGKFTGKTYGSFTGGYNANGAYQDVVTAPGSVWSAEGFGLSHQQDLIQGGNQFWFEVTFRDATDTILAMFRSAILDPVGAAGVTPGVWYDLPVTNVYDIGDTTYSTITNTASNFTAPAGTTKVRYQANFAQLAGYPGGSIYFDDLNLTKIAGTDPDITASPVNHTKIEGQSVSFTVTAAGGSTLHYVWHKDTVDLSNGGNISGATSSTLTVSNLSTTDAGSYSVTVSDNHGSLDSSPGILTVLTATQAVNYVLDPGFEDGTAFGPHWTPYNGAGIQAAYVHDGVYAGRASGNGAGSYNGFFQDTSTDEIHTVAPGSIFAADGWVMTPGGSPIAADNTAWIEVHFHDANGNMIGLYKSTVIDANFPMDTWVDLPVTNIIAFWSDYSVAGTAKYLTAPAGTSYVRVQTVFHQGTGGGGGNVYFDDLSLLPKPAVKITASVGGGSIHLSFPTQVLTSYRVLYKNALSDSTWQLLQTVSGDGTVKTVSDPLGQDRKFYAVNTL